jgi:hypothetical protein
MKRLAMLSPTPIIVSLLGTILLYSSEDLRAQERAAIAVKNKRFEPAEIRGPANRPLSIQVKNLDGAPIEFESVSLRVEKVMFERSLLVAMNFLTIDDSVPKPFSPRQLLWAPCSKCDATVA